MKMKKRGKKITLFLIDGDANGRIMCELSNWSGKSYKIPRTYIKNSEDREDLSNTGVYILFGIHSPNAPRLFFYFRLKLLPYRCRHSQIQVKLSISFFSSF